MASWRLGIPAGSVTANPGTDSTKCTLEAFSNLDLKISRLGP
jgi:hypothetical protein